MSFLSARLKSGLSQAAAAERLGVSAPSVSQWETGITQPKTDKLLEIASLYGCTVDELLSSSATPPHNGISAIEGYANTLRGLISYHERMTMGNYPERDFYLDALKFALTCVEEKILK